MWTFKETPLALARVWPVSQPQHKANSLPSLNLVPASKTQSVTSQRKMEAAHPQLHTHVSVWMTQGGACFTLMYSVLNRDTGRRASAPLLQIRWVQQERAERVCASPCWAGSHRSCSASQGDAADPARCRHLWRGWWPSSQRSLPRPKQVRNTVKDI